MTAAGVATEEQRRYAVAVAALVAGAVAMGASVLFVRWADVGPYASAFWRVFLALPFLWGWMRLEGPPQRLALDRPILLAGLFFTGDLFFWHLAILGTTVANATFLATTAPIWVALGAWLVLGETVGARILAGLALCILGGFALIGESYGFAPQRLAGDLFGIATALFFGCYVLSVRAGRARHGAAALMFCSTAITAACLFVIALAFEPRILPQSLAGAGALVALALISQVGGQGLVRPLKIGDRLPLADAVAAPFGRGRFLDRRRDGGQVLVRAALEQRLVAGDATEAERDRRVDRLRDHHHLAVALEAAEADTADQVARGRVRALDVHQTIGTGRDHGGRPSVVVGCGVVALRA